MVEYPATVLVLLLQPLLLRQLLLYQPKKSS